MPLPDSDATANLALSMGLLPESEGGPGAYFAPAGTLLIDTQVGGWDFHLPYDLSCPCHFFGQDDQYCLPACPFGS